MISVVIPVGPERQRNVNLVLRSLERQTFRDFDVIVVSNDQELSLDYYDLDLNLYYNPNKTLNLGAVNRNFGVMMTINPYIVFLDSDVVLQKDALAYYAEDFGNFGNRVVLGLYHWLGPAEVSQDDLDDLDAFIARRDGREPHFLATHQNYRYCDYPRCLECLTGNMGVSQHVYWDVYYTQKEHGAIGSGAFDEGLARGIDGDFGIALLYSGFTWSYDRRIVGWHLYHQPLHADLPEPFTRIREKWHSDDSWIGKMTWGGEIPLDTR